MEHCRYSTVCKPCLPSILSRASGSALASIAVCLLLGSASQAAQPLYHVSPWATLPEASSNVVRVINDAGNGAVSANIASRSRALRLSAQRGLENLRQPPQTDFSTALGLNNLGDIVGTSNKLDGQRAYRSTADGTTLELMPLAGNSATAAYAINNAREAVGYSSGPQGLRAVIWDQGGRVAALPTVSGSVSTLALGINASGTVVGIARFADRQAAVEWRRNAVRLLDTVQGTLNSEALAINARGTIVGSSGSASLRRRAVMWNADGTVDDLGTFAGGFSSRALGINDKNEVVGVAESRDGNRAFIWTKQDGMRNLNDLVTLPAGLVLTQATGINNSGTILAVGYLDNHAGAVASPANGEQPRYENHELPLQVVKLTLVNRL